jgi:hypothetical protein
MPGASRTFAGMTKLPCNRGRSSRRGVTACLTAFGTDEEVAETLGLAAGAETLGRKDAARGGGGAVVVVGTVAVVVGAFAAVVVVVVGAVPVLASTVAAGAGRAAVVAAPTASG